MDQDTIQSQQSVMQEHHTHHQTHHHYMHHKQKSSSIIKALLIGGPVVFIALLIAITASITPRAPKETSLMMQQETQEISEPNVMMENTAEQSWISKLFGGGKKVMQRAPTQAPPPQEMEAEVPARRLEASAFTGTIIDGNAYYCKSGFLAVADTTSSNLVNKNTLGQPTSVTVDTREKDASGNTVTIPYPVFEASSSVDAQSINASQPSEPTVIPVAQFGTNGYPYLTHVMVFDADVQKDTDSDPLNTNPHYPSSYIQITYADVQNHSTPYIIYPISGTNISMATDANGSYKLNITDGYVKEIKMIPGRHWPIDAKGDRRDSSWFGGICGASPISPTPTLTPTRTPNGPQCMGLIATIGRGMTNGIISVTGANASYAQLRAFLNGSLSPISFTPAALDKYGSASFSYAVPSTATSVSVEGRVCTDAAGTTCSAWGSGSPSACSAAQTYTTTTTPTITPTRTPTRMPSITPTVTTTQPSASCTNLTASSKGFYQSTSYTCTGKNISEGLLYVYYDGSTTPGQTIHMQADITHTSVSFPSVYFPATAKSAVAKCSVCNDKNNDGSITLSSECTAPTSISASCTASSQAPPVTPVPGAPTCKGLIKYATSSPNTYSFVLCADSNVDPAIGLRQYVQVIEDGVSHSTIEFPTTGIGMTYDPNPSYPGKYNRSVSFTKNPATKDLRVLTKICVDDGSGKCINFGEVPACNYSETFVTTITPTRSPTITPTKTISPTPPTAASCPSKLYFYQDSGSSDSVLYSADVSGTNISNLATPKAIGPLYKNCDIEAAESGWDNRLYAFMGSGHGTINNGYNNRNRYDGWVMQIDPSTGELYEYFNTGFSELVAAAREDASGKTVIVKSEYCDAAHQAQGVGCIIRVDLVNKKADYLFTLETNIESLALDASGKFFWGTGNSSTSHTASGGKSVYKIYLNALSNGSHVEKASWTLPSSKDVEAAFTLGQIGSPPAGGDIVVFGLHNQPSSSFVTMDMSASATNIATQPTIKQTIGTSGTGVYDPETIFQVCGAPVAPNSSKKIQLNACASDTVIAPRTGTTDQNVAITTQYDTAKKQVILTWPALRNITTAYIKRYAIYSTDPAGSDVRVKFISLSPTAVKGTDTPSDQSATALYAYSLCVRVAGETQDRCSDNTKMVPTSSIAGTVSSIALPATSAPAAAQVMVQEPTEEVSEPTMWERILEILGF